MGTVTIGANTYPVYGDLPSAKIYLAGSVGPGPDTWTALGTDDLRSKFMVAAYRYLEAQSWNPTTAGDTATRGAIVAFQNAEYELAAILSANAAVNAASDQGSNVMLLRAGPVEVEYFKPTGGGSPGATKFPLEVQRLIGAYLQSTVTVTGKAYNSNDPDCEDFADVDSSFDEDAGYLRTQPL